MTMTIEHSGARRIGLSGYTGGCRCEGCVGARMQWQRNYVKRRYAVRGQRLMVAASNSRTHLLWLRDNGMTYKQVAALVGLSPNHIRRIAVGQTKRVHRRTEAQILRLDRHLVPDDARIDSGLSWRRLRGLMALGWSAHLLASEMGYSRNSDRRTIPMGRRRTTAMKARAVIALCRKYGTSLGPSDFSRRNARKLGWEPYGSWDDDLDELTDHVSVEYRQAIG